MQKAQPRLQQLVKPSVPIIKSLAPQIPASGYRPSAELPRKECARSREESIGGARDETHGPAARALVLSPLTQASHCGSDFRASMPVHCHHGGSGMTMPTLVFRSCRSRFDDIDNDMSACASPVMSRESPHNGCR